MFFDSRRGAAAPAGPGGPGGPMTRGGLSQVGPEWLVEQLEGSDPSPRLIDVREVHEFDGPMGHIEGAELVPLGSLLAAAESWDRSETLVMICHSGARSAHATMALSQMGFESVHNLQGGMIAWLRSSR